MKMSVKKYESYIKIQEFLEDIYMYLNNISTTQSTDEFECQKSNEKRRELIENCKHIRSIFEAEFHPHDDVVDSSYLDMNGAGMNRNQRPNSAVFDEDGNAESREDYMNMISSSSIDQSENAYDIYETASSMELKDENKCPYTGLPAAHLKIMNSSQVGLLTRVEKKLFFPQAKDFYAGILDKWILLYPSKSNDMKPSECFYPKSVESDKTENQFNVVTNSGKKFHFQAPNADEFNNWMKRIRKIVDDGDSCQLRDKQPSQLSFRKLPSPPLGEENLDSGSSSENYYGFNRSSNQTVINNEERLYEEPTRRSQESRETPPRLPAKTGKKVQDDSIHGYDVPKPTKSIETLHEDEIISASPSPSPETTSPEKSRTKVSEMTAILSSINLVSPEEKRKSAHVSKVKKMSSPDKAEEKRTSPMKSWFTKQIKRRVSKRDKTPEVMEGENEEPLTSVKGSKVNMIISQLEKKGQLSKRLKNRKSAGFSETEDYETVCVRN